MPITERLRQLGLFDARAPRYTSYPPANHFSETVGPDQTAAWLAAIPEGQRVSLYLHIPYCRRLCWFCACRTQGTATDRPLVPYLDLLKREMALVGRHLPGNVEISQIHLGGGTPTLLPPDLIRDLGAALKTYRPWADDIQFSVEIDPTEVDQARIDALAEVGMTRASIGVQDFDPKVQDAIGRQQSFSDTRDVVKMLRDAGVTSLNMDILYGLPFQTKARMADSVQRVLSLNPDRVALYGYAHVPWMAKRQVLIPADELPSAEERLELFDTARDLFLWDDYVEIGIDHYARKDDSLAVAAREGRLHRNFQGYTDDTSEVLIGMGASAISRYPQGFAQNSSTSSKYAVAIDGGTLATARGHAMSDDDRLRSAMIERLMCDFGLDIEALAKQFGLPEAALFDMTDTMRQRFADQLVVEGHKIRLTDHARLIARLAAQEIDAYAMPEGRHSRAL
ncbi:oxygen-independent coproporphyrinogen III oxidase [Loktanella sp. IMCC34160]|uniref:oxygen-independent coproporphyrinogen III oxidase n=1 Tax=Loktanella sp. IMCC34160 TaxID=2510646 RepID=UPI00101D6D60|nr:oxygen-independent coproporphyrinogen III oxidase [Loktanella sp. IMCC34160]RYG92688.1 oxygen-independent coproporphyrinogen III oxidase [Loktanella sp. IMCC34160]